MWQHVDPPLDVDGLIADLKWKDLRSYWDRVLASCEGDEDDMGLDTAVETYMELQPAFAGLLRQLQVTITVVPENRGCDDENDDTDDDDAIDSGGVVLATGGLEELYRHDYGRLHSRHPLHPLHPLLLGRSGRGGSGRGTDDDHDIDDDNDNDDNEDDEGESENGEADALRTLVRIVPTRAAEGGCGGVTRGRMEISMCRPAVAKW